MQVDYRDNLNNKIDQCFAHVEQTNRDNPSVTLMLKIRKLDMVLKVCKGGEMLQPSITLNTLNGAKLMLKIIKTFTTVSPEVTNEKQSEWNNSTIVTMDRMGLGHPDYQG